MNRSLAIAFLGIALIIGGMVKADAAGPNNEFKIGFVDVNDILVNTPAGKRASQKLKKVLTQKQKELDQKQQALQKYAAELEKQRMVLKPDVFKERQAELQKRYVELQEVYVKLERELVSEEAKLRDEILRKAEPVIQTIAKQKGFDMVIHKNALAWSVKALDLTDEVSKRLK